MAGLEPSVVHTSHLTIWVTVIVPLYREKAEAQRDPNHPIKRAQSRDSSPGSGTPLVMLVLGLNLLFSSQT